ncbi:MAG: aminotransferase class I/II-fold pyridoxal phosphate-dependent enzyme [Eubacteriaceae bacterium]|nr:aminotransferase class I/II-fold pyridoxal phosphate-dependent enzyme [Eubacteriaceae bacterium]
MSQMVIDSCLRAGGSDPIFRMAAMANEKKAEIGKDKVIDSTLGALFDDAGRLVCFDAVYDTMKSLDNCDIASYAGIGGIPSYLKSAIGDCFGDDLPDAYIEAVATPGGTGAIRHAFCNYTELGDAILVSDWHWQPYETIAAENRRQVAFFPLFNDKNAFHLSAFKEKFNELAEKQKRVLTVLNTPAHNPTGYSISTEEWQAILSFLKEKAESGIPIIVLCDIAYIDYASKEERAFTQLLSDLPENVLFLFAFSASKSYTMYGLRNGALICLSSSEETVKEFVNTCSFSNRGTWSNGTRCAMEIVAKIKENPELQARFSAERNKHKAVLQKRAEAFLKAAEKAQLPTLPYKSGFFITIPCEQSQKVAERLMEDNLFMVAINGGLRFAVCAVPEFQCAQAPKMIANAIQVVS